MPSPSLILFALVLSISGSQGQLVDLDPRGISPPARTPGTKGSGTKGSGTKGKTNEQLESFHRSVEIVSGVKLSGDLHQREATDHDLGTYAEGQPLFQAKQRRAETKVYLSKMEETFNVIYIAEDEALADELGEMRPENPSTPPTKMPFTRTLTSPFLQKTVSYYHPYRSSDVCGAWLSLIDYCGPSGDTTCYCSSSTDYVPDQWNSLAAACSGLERDCFNEPGDDGLCQLKTFASGDAKGFCPTTDTDGESLSTARFGVHRAAKISTSRDTFADQDVSPHATTAAAPLTAVDDFETTSETTSEIDTSEPTSTSASRTQVDTSSSSSATVSSNDSAESLNVSATSMLSTSSASPSEEAAATQEPSQSITTFLCITDSWILHLWLCMLGATLWV